MTSADSHPFSREPLKSVWTLVALMPALSRVPMAPAISIRPLCMFLLPMLAFVRDRQSIRRMVPALIACESWYAAPAAFSELAPEAAASFEKPLMTDVA